MGDIIHVAPGDIESMSMQIIGNELGQRAITAQCMPVVKRVIHATADFGFADTLVFSPGVIESVVALLRSGASIVTDTRMIAVGINTTLADRFGCHVYCYMDDPQVATEAIRLGVTRARVCMDRAAELKGPVVVVVGNAPTALVRLHELVSLGQWKPNAVVAVPVGFVNVVEAKDLVLGMDIPSIVNPGRRGGSTVAVAIVNALLLMVRDGLA